MAKRGRKLKEWTNEEIEQVEALAGYGLSIEKIAPMFYIEGDDGQMQPMSKNTFDRYKDADHRISGAIEKGRSISESQMAQMAFSVAMGRKEIIEIKDGKETVIEKGAAPNAAMIMFWLKCRARWSETQNVRIEPGGADEGKTWAQVCAEYDRELDEKEKAAPVIKQAPRKTKQKSKSAKPKPKKRNARKKPKRARSKATAKK